VKKSQAKCESNTLSTRDRIFKFLVTYKQDHNGNTPSQQEIADACYISTSTVNHHLMKLEIEGRILVQGRRLIEIIGGTWEIPLEGVSPAETEPVHRVRREAKADGAGESAHEPTDDFPSN